MELTEYQVADMTARGVYLGLTALLLVGVAIVAVFALHGENYMSDITSPPKHTNRLAKETSPYLLQHARNPVDWYPWGEKAFERAEREDKPIFLSIGYSTCHWCHVMEAESFENQEIAKIMNEYFVCIKVDREQRPDVDEIYMNAVVMTTGSGGWPLSVFLTPKGEPFYGGTYFPPEDMFGRPGFKRILLSVADAWETKRQDLVNSAGRLTKYLEGAQPSAGEAKLSTEMLHEAYETFRGTFDAVNGGFGSAPKFPQPANLSMLLSYWDRTGEDEALRMVEETLDAMADGGVYDHLGGGFHRYATDAHWLVPHFEKMLYDQALLSKVYVEAYQVTSKQQHARVAREIFDYVLRDMTDATGGFYSAEDADSEGEEGTFYLWEPGQIVEVLGDEQAKLFNARYGVTRKGNFEKGKTILNITASIDNLAKKFQTDRAEIEDVLSAARKKLFEKREERIRPHLDDKVITAWNGLMISSLAYGGAALDEKKYVQAAERSAEFLLRKVQNNGRLMRYYRDGQALEKGFLDDYAFLTMGLLDLYEATFETKWLIEAKNLAEKMVELFAHDESGGFYLTGRDSEKLIARTRPGSDGAVPSGNSISALALLKLGRMTMDRDLERRGRGVIEAFSAQLERVPAYSTVMLEAMSFSLGPGSEIVIAGKTDDAETRQMLNLIHSKFLPNAVVLLHDQDGAASSLYDIAPFVKNQTAIEGKATAYVCRNYACGKPATSAGELSEMLAALSEKASTDELAR